MCEDVLDNLEPFFEDKELSFDPEVNEQQLNELHSIFKNDFITNPFQFDSSTVLIKEVNSEHKGQPDFFKNYLHDFVHCITRKNDLTNRRQLEPMRANRIHWIKPILLNSSDKRIKYYKFTENDGKVRDYFWYEEKEYVVILEKKSNDYWLVTGHCVDDKMKHSRRYQKYRFK